MTDRNGVESDNCPNCRGIWLDRGELEKYIERSADHYFRKEDYLADYKRYGYDKYNDDSYREHPHKKKSFLGDLFDF